MTTTSGKPEVAAVVIYNEHGEVLLLQRRRPTPSGYVWVLPGGKIERGETPQRAAERELWEEIGLVTPSEHEDQYAYRACRPQGQFRVHPNDEHDWAYHYFLLKRPTFQVDALEDTFCGYGWFHPDHLPEKCTPAVQEFVRTAKEVHSIYEGLKQ